MSKLIILRGNSGSGKSTVAAALRPLLGDRVALAGQDYLRRELLRGDQDDTVGLISAVVTHCLSRSYDVIVDGILDNVRFGPMLRSLLEAHRGPAQVCYFSLSFEETARRHQTRALSEVLSAEEMRPWYRENDLLGWPGEQIITAPESAEQVVTRVMSHF